MSDFRCTVSADLIARAYLCASKEQTRYYLNGVYVSPAPQGGALLVATDGHCMFVAHDAEATVTGDGIVQLTAETLKACKAKARTPRLLIVEDNRAKVEEDCNAVALQPGAALVEGTFPDWRRVIPSALADGAPAVNLDAAILARLSAALCASKTPKVTLAPSGNELAPYYVFGDLQNAFGILMPCRASRTYAIPAWATAKPAEEPAAA